MNRKKEGRSYETAQTCEVCGQPLRLYYVNKDDEGWLAACSEPMCATLHQGSSRPGREAGRSRVWL